MTIGAMGTVGFVSVAFAMVHERQQPRLSPRHDQLLTGVCTGAELQGTHQVLGSAIGVATIVQASVGSFIHSFTPEERRHHALATTYHKVRPYALSSGKSWRS